MNAQRQEEVTEKDFAFTPECFKRMFEDTAWTLAECGSMPEPDHYTYCKVLSDVFGYTTYNGDYDLKMAPWFIGVIRSWLGRTTFEYIEKSEEHHERYLIICSMLGHRFLTWGCSIRGAMLFAHHPVPVSEIFSCHSTWLEKKMFNGKDDLEAAFRGLILMYEEHIMSHVN